MHSGCRQEQNVPVEIEVVISIHEENHTSPLQVSIENKTRGAYGYLWLFDGGKPASSSEKNPGIISFSEPGEHIITLEAWNEGTRTGKKFSVRVDSAVAVDFTAEADINNYAPAVFYIKNLSAGGTTYKWTFEGGTPAAYEGVSPPPVKYDSEGTYRISLTAWNGSATFTVDREIEVRESPEASFSIIPSFEDEDDMEAPLRASFDVYLRGIETLLWSCDSAVITNPEAAEAEIYFPKAGTYTVYLAASNGKETKKVSQEITVRENTNLRTHENIRLGINTATDNYATHYSTRLRKAFKVSEINSANASMTDIVFFGLNANFTYNMFVSPARLSETTFPAIPEAVHTYFINKTELGTLNITENQFKSMNTDALLKNLPVSSVSYGDDFFTDAPLPRVVLFETGDGRKGAILVKEMTSNGKNNSHITIDIKIQKNDW